jgi:hypothetical protein
MDRIDPLIETASARLRELEPSAVAVVVTGSYAKGTADADSDLDLTAITDGGPREHYRTWFQERPGTKPLHISAGARTLEGWLAKREETQEWALGFACVYEAVYVWATDDARRRLGEDPSNYHPAAPSQLEDFVEALVKVRRAQAHGDSAGVRLFAFQAGLLAPGLLRLLNPLRVVHDRRDALDAALSLPVAPPCCR